MAKCPESLIEPFMSPHSFFLFLFLLLAQTWKTFRQLSLFVFLTSTEIKPLTFILVGIQKVLKLGVKDLQVFLYEDLLTLPGQFVLGGFMEVNLHTPLLLQQSSLRLKTTQQSEIVTFLKKQKKKHSFLSSVTARRRLYLLHVLGDGVLLEELCALACVETFCVSEELTFKVLFVHGQRRAFGEGVLFVQAQFNWRGKGRGGKTQGAGFNLSCYFIQRCLQIGST